MTSENDRTGSTAPRVTRRTADDRRGVQGEGLAVVEVRDQGADGVGAASGVGGRAVGNEAAAAVGSQACRREPTISPVDPGAVAHGRIPGLESRERTE